MPGGMAMNTNGYRPPFPSPGHPLDAGTVRENPVVALTHAAHGELQQLQPAPRQLPYHRALIRLGRRRHS